LEKGKVLSAIWEKWNKVLYLLNVKGSNIYFYIVLGIHKCKKAKAFGTLSYCVRVILSANL